MSLISCPECGQKVSDQAERFMDCGYPLTEAEINQISKNRAMDRRIGVVLASVVIAWLLLRILFSE